MGVWLLFASITIAGPVDRVLFVIDERTVTQIDVAFETFFDEHDPKALPALVDPALPTAERLRDIAVIRQLAGDTSVFRPTNADVRARADAVLATWPRADDGLVALAAWGLDEPGFLGFVYSRLVVERCVLRGVGAVGTQDWAGRYLAWIELQRSRVDIREPKADP